MIVTRRHFNLDCIIYQLNEKSLEAVLKVSRPAGIKGTNPGLPGTKNE
jgi:hypothetical protein